MARATRSNDWGFPRWRGYGGKREAAEVRRCDRHGCDEPGDRPAPKAPNKPDRWYFCERHAAEYNRNWNYFEGLTAEEARSEEHTSELQSLMRISYAVFCLKKKITLAHKTHCQWKQHTSNIQAQTRITNTLNKCQIQ